MIRKLLFLFACVATTVGAWAQSASYVFDTSSLGTLKIKAQGDLTNYSSTEDVTTTTFTSAAVGNVFTSDAGADVTTSTVYNSSNQYYTATRDWTPLFSGGVPTTEGNHASNIYTTKNWDVTKVTAADTYIYPVYLDGATTQWDAASAYLYSISGPSTTDKWTTSALTADGVYVYPASLGDASYSWNTDLTDGKYIYYGFINWESKFEVSSIVANTSTPNIENVLNGGSPKQYAYYYIISEEELTINNSYETSNVNFVTPAMVITSAPLTITANRLISGAYSVPGTYDYNGTTYLQYVLSTSEISDNVTYDMSELASHNITPLIDMSEYHGNVTTVNIGQRITTGTEPGYSTNTFAYNDVSYLYYASSDNELVVGEDYDINSVILLTNVDAYRATKTPIVKQGDRVTDADYDPNRNKITYNGETYLGYVVSSVEWPSTTVYVGDPNVQLMTEDFATENYMSLTTKYTAGSDLYVSKDGGDNKSLLTQNTEYTYETGDLFFTPGTTTYNAITDNADYFSAHASYLNTETTPVTRTFKEALLAEINAGSYTSVVFEQDGDNITIDPAIVQTILFPNNAANGHITNLDLSAATITTFEKAFDNPGADYSYSTTLEELTLPMIAGNVVPANVLPSGYTNGSCPLRTVNVPSGYTALGDNAFLGQNKLNTVNLPSSVTTIGGYAFQNCSSITSFDFVDGLQTIGEYAFNGTQLAEVSFPSSLRKICDAAFATITTLNKITLNEGLEYIGNAAFSLDSKNQEIETLIIPSTMRYIGPAAFNCRWIKDIFFTSEKAPIMPLGNSIVSTQSTNCTAFDDNIHMGYNGFTQNKSLSLNSDIATQGYANRENYHNQDYYFCVLHFPPTLTLEQAETYTDVTRRYETYYYPANEHGIGAPGTNFDYNSHNGGGCRVCTEEQENALFAKHGAGNSISFGLGIFYNLGGIVDPGFEDTYQGSQKIWPSQGQWNRSFVLNSLGYKWNGVDLYRPNLTTDELDIYAEAGYLTEEQLTSLKAVAGANGVVDAANVTDEDLKALYDNLQLMAYLGTRQFVLADADIQSSNEYKIPVKGGKWWTICVPFNMTKKMINDTFGEGTHVCLFSSVDRDAESDQKKITLYFQNDVYTYKTKRVNETTWDFSKTNSAPEDDDVVIWAHESYMIHPAITDEDAVFVVENYEPVTGNPVPTIVNANADKSVEDHTEYRFVGNYATILGNEADGTPIVTKIPQYSYMYALKKGQSDYKFWFNTSKNISWAANKSVVQATARDGGFTDNKNFFGGNTVKAKQNSVFGDYEFFEDNLSTDIENVTIVAGDGKDAEVVYSINGQIVNKNAMRRGIYIKNGNKIVVR